MCEGGKNNLEAFELCALAAMKYNNSVGNNNFKRSPSIHSSLSLFENTPSDPGAVFGVGNFKRSPSTNSNLSLAANFKMPTLAFKRTSTASVTSLKSPSSQSTCSNLSSADQQSCEVRLLRTFSPEPSNIRIPPVISENEAYQSPAGQQQQSFSQQQQLHMQQQQQQQTKKKTRPNSLCCNPNFDAVQEHNNMLIRNTLMRSSQPKLQRPTTLFKSSSPSPDFMKSPPRGTTNNNNYGFFSPGTADQRFFHPAAVAGNSSGFDSELSTPTSSICSTNSNMVIKSPQMDVVSPNNAQIRQNGLSRRTSYRTHPKMAIPVAAPMSPAGSEFSLDCSSSSMVKSPTSNLRSMCQSPNSDSLFMQSIAEDSSSVTSSSTNINPNLGAPHPPPPAVSSSIPVFDLKSPKIYESLKSHLSTSSQTSSSDGSQKINSDFSDSSSISYKAERALVKRTQDLALDSHSAMMAAMSPPPDTDDPKVLGNLNFVSPKAGVYRPSSGKKSKHNCSIM